MFDPRDLVLEIWNWFLTRTRTKHVTFKALRNKNQVETKFKYQISKAKVLVLKTPKVNGNQVQILGQKVYFTRISITLLNDPDFGIICWTLGFPGLRDDQPAVFVPCSLLIYSYSGMLILKVCSFFLFENFDIDQLCFLVVLYPVS